MAEKNKDSESKQIQHKGRRAVQPSAADSTVMVANTMTMAKKKDIPVICQQIRKYREKKGMEQKELAAKLGIHSNAISNWENGRTRPDLALLPKICEILRITFYELYDLPLPIDTFNEEEQRIISKYQELSPGHKYAIECMLDNLNEAEDAEICKHIIEKTEFTKRLAAGFDPGEEFDDKGETIYLYRSSETEKGDCVFTVSGDSMEPEYHNGDKVLVTRYPDCTIEPGDVGAFITGNEAYIKVYQKDGLHSLNKRYKTMRFTENDSVYIIGKVVSKLSPSDIVTFEDAQRYHRIVERQKITASELE